MLTDTPANEEGAARIAAEFRSFNSLHRLLTIALRCDTPLIGILEAARNDAEKRDAHGDLQLVAMLVSCDMTALGMYLSGSISFGLCPQSGKAVEYRERIHCLTQQQREMYNRRAAAWQAVLRNIDEALLITNGGRRARATALNRFWADHQRFFRQVICAFKVPSVIAETEAALSEAKSVVI